MTTISLENRLLLPPATGDCGSAEVAAAAADDDNGDDNGGDDDDDGGSGWLAENLPQLR